MKVIKPKVLMDLQWRMYRPRYYRDTSEVPETLKVTKDYKRTNFVSFIRGAGKPVYLAEVRQDDMRSMKRLTVLKRLSGLGVALTCLLLIGILGLNYYLGKQLALEEAEAETLEMGNIGVEEAVTYDLETGLPIYSNEFNLMVISPRVPDEVGYTCETMTIGGVEVDKRIADALSLLLQAAEDAEHPLELVRGYVTAEEQDVLYWDEVEKLQKEGATYLMSEYNASLTVERAHESDAQTGLSVKIKTNYKDFTKTHKYQWLKENMAEYGFVFRYPPRSVGFTGHQIDTTVIRYVGRANAITMRQLSMCLEEYISYIYAR